MLEGSGVFRECPTGAYIDILKAGIFCEGGVDYWSVSYSSEEGGYILEGGLDFGRDAYLRGVYSGRAG